MEMKAAVNLWNLIQVELLNFLSSSDRIAHGVLARGCIWISAQVVFEYVSPGTSLMVLCQICVGVSADKTRDATDPLKDVCVFVYCKIWAVLWPVPSPFIFKNEASRSMFLQEYLQLLMVT